MAGPMNIGDMSYTAGEAITKQYAVKLNGDNTLNVADSQGEFCFGIAQEGATAGDATNQRQLAVRSIGYSYAIAGGNIAAGALLTVTATGTLMTAASGDYVIGMATMAAVANDQFVVLLLPNGNPLA